MSGRPTGAPPLRERVGRLAILLGAGGLLTAGTPGPAAAPGAGSGNGFRLCIWGDTQAYVRSAWTPGKREAYASQVDFALDGRCDAVLHMGDVTWGFPKSSHAEVQDQWDRTRDVLAPLRASKVVFSPAQGNHDVVSQYRAFVDEWNGPRRDRFEAVSASGRSHSLLASVGGIRQLVVSVGCGFSRPEFEFLKQRIAAHPGVPTIVQSHAAVMNGRPLRLAIRHDRYVNALCPADAAGQAAPSKDEVRAYLRDTPQIWLVAGGHYWVSMAGLDGVRGAEHPQPLLLVTQDATGRRNGGDGWIGLLTVDTDSGEARYRQYSHHRRLWMGPGDDWAAREINPLRWRERGFPPATSAAAPFSPPPPRRGGWLDDDRCVAAWFTNGGLDGANHCAAADPYQLVLERGGRSVDATTDPDRLPAGSAPGSSGHWHAGLDASEKNVRLGPDRSRLGRTPDTGFACFWTRGPTRNPRRGPQALRWLDSGDGLRIEALYAEPGVPDGTTRFRVGDTSFDAPAELTVPFGAFHHLCLGWTRSAPAEPYRLAATLNGADACPSGGCPTASGDPLGSGPASGRLRVGLQTTHPKPPPGDPRPVNGKEHVLYELLLVRDTPLSPARARWIAACGAAGEADPAQRRDAYLGGEAGALEGPNGETRCPR